LTLPSHLLVRRDDLSAIELRPAEPVTADPGEAILRVDRFALTANNITYGLTGDIIGYWRFFPAPDGWGRIPVWGIGTVTSSEQSNVTPGARYYGYFPMSPELTVRPERISGRAFTDTTPHRAELPAVYNQYSLMSEANGFDPAFDNHYMLYRPLFTTSFVLDDYLADNDFFGARSVILGSASSKTAFGLAFMLRRRTGVTVVGLTSPLNAAFVNGLDLYDEVLTYDAIESLPREPSVYVDMAGNRDVLARLHHHLADDVMASCGVGATHWEAREGEDPRSLPGARPTMFFAPSQIMKRNDELGPAVYQGQIAEATRSFLSEVDQWVTIEEHPFSEIEAVYRTVLAGPPPDRGYVVVNG
jgi:hypothetical protein